MTADTSAMSTYSLDAYVGIRNVFQPAKDRLRHTYSNTFEVFSPEVVITLVVQHCNLPT